MIATDLSGPRLAELLLAELDGRDLGPLQRISIPESDDAARVQIEGGETYRVDMDGREVATIEVGKSAVHVRTTNGRFRIETGPQVKAAVDEVVRQVQASS